MGKGRMSLIDVRAMVKELKQRIEGMRVQNVYNINQKTYMFKIQSSNGKEILLIESGIRIHLTKYNRPKDSMPNSFASKLRKHIRNRVLNKIEQVGTDRVIDMEFG
eukprot:jgi/Bigna1/127566/aug1.4_g2274